MNPSQMIEEAHRFAERYRVNRGSGFRLSNIDPADTAGLKSKKRARAALAHGVRMLSEMQERLYAGGAWSLLLIFQAMDAAGKDGAIKHVMSGVNPQGCHVSSFKAPSSGELAHDYLWRCLKRLPERGQIGIFNRSYYEEVLIVRVHPEILNRQKLPPSLVTRTIWKERFEDINAVEKYLIRNGVVIRKFFLHLSKEEQRKRFLKRLDRPDKNWKFSMNDVRERQFWDQYTKAYEEMIRHTATRHAPWYVVPADNKWFTRLIVAAAVIDAMASLNLEFPRVNDTKLKELAAAREQLGITG